MGGLVETEAELEQSMREATQGDAENDKFFIRLLLFRLCRLRNCSKNLSNSIQSFIDVGLPKLKLFHCKLFNSWKLHPRLTEKCPPERITGRQHDFAFCLKDFNWLSNNL